MDNARSSIDQQDNTPARPASAHPARELWNALCSPAHRWWFWPIVITVTLVIALHPLDRLIDGKLSASMLAGDVRRELQTLQQWGAIGSVILACVIILLLDRAKRFRVFDLALACGVAALGALAAKMLIGRPRPKFGDHDAFLGPFGQYPLIDKAGKPFLAHAWEISKPISSDLWSMPSSHTAAGVAFGVALTYLYPRLWPVAIFMGVLVAFARLLFDAHYLTDTICGAGIGFVLASAVMRGRWISRWAKE
jgi:membrane-associated phospholipid phosphatase